MKTFILTRTDEVGIVLLTKKEEPLMLDRYGLKLFWKYGEDKGGWKYNSSIRRLYRVEPVMVGKRVVMRNIIFRHELLGTRNSQVVNGDEMDLRVTNLIPCREVTPIS